MRLGVGSRVATLLLLGSLIGGFVNIPLFPLSAERVMSGREVLAFAMIYVVPEVIDWPGMIIAATAYS